MEALQGAMQVQQWPDLSCLWSLPVPSDHLNRWSPKSWTKWTLLSLCRHWWAFYSHFTGVAHRLGGWSLDILSKDERKGWISSDLWANVLVLFWRKFFTLRPLYFIPEHWYKKYTISPCSICFLYASSLILFNAQLVSSRGECAPLCTWAFPVCVVTHCLCKWLCLWTLTFPSQAVKEGVLDNVGSEHDMNAMEKWVKNMLPLGGIN